MNKNTRYFKNREQIRAKENSREYKDKRNERLRAFFSIPENRQRKSNYFKIFYSKTILKKKSKELEKALKVVAKIEAIIKKHKSILEIHEQT